MSSFCIFPSLFFSQHRGFFSRMMLVFLLFAAVAWSQIATTCETGIVNGIVGQQFEGAATATAAETCNTFYDNTILTAQSSPQLPIGVSQGGVSFSLQSSNAGGDSYSVSIGWVPASSTSGGADSGATYTRRGSISTFSMTSALETGSATLSGIVPVGSKPALQICCNNPLHGATCSNVGASTISVCWDPSPAPAIQTLIFASSTCSGSPVAQIVTPVAAGNGCQNVACNNNALASQCIWSVPAALTGATVSSTIYNQPSCPTANIATTLVEAYSAVGSTCFTGTAQTTLIQALFNNFGYPSPVGAESVTFACSNGITALQSFTASTTCSGASTVLVPTKFTVDDDVCTNTEGGGSYQNVGLPSCTATTTTTTATTRPASSSKFAATAIAAILCLTLVVLL